MGEGHVHGSVRLRWSAAGRRIALALVLASGAAAARARAQEEGQGEATERRRIPPARVTGVRMAELPMKPERVWKALSANGRQDGAS